MSTQPEPLRLADALEMRGFLGTTAHDASDCLRRLHEVNQELLEALKAMLDVHGVTQEYADKHIQIPQSWVEVSDLAREAIKKATGESK